MGRKVSKPRRPRTLHKEISRPRSDLNEGLARVSTEIASLVAAVNQVRDVLVERLDVRDKVDQLDRRVSLLERKAG